MKRLGLVVPLLLIIGPALLCACSATGVTQEQISAAPSGPLPLNEAEKTSIAMIQDNYRDIAKINANIMAVVLDARPLPDELVAQLNKTLKSKSKVVLFWDDYQYPGKRMISVQKAWDRVREDDVKFTDKLVDFVNHPASDKKMEAAVHALAAMGKDWGRCKAEIKELKAQAASQTGTASPVKSASPSP
jgi:hypothetical protein